MPDLLDKPSLKKQKTSTTISSDASKKKEAERVVSPSVRDTVDEEDPPVPPEDEKPEQSETMDVYAADTDKGPSNEGVEDDEDAEQAGEEGGDSEEGDDLVAEEATKAGDEDAEKVDKTIKDESGVFKIQKANGTIVDPKPFVFPATWNVTWLADDKPIEAQNCEDRLNKFKKEGLVNGTEKNKHHSLPHGLDLARCLGIEIDDEAEAKVLDEQFTEMRKEWKSQFPKSKKQNETAFALYEAQIMADAYEWALGKFETQAALHDEGHKPDDRLKHYRKQATDRRTKVDNMTKKRKEQEEKRKKDAKERAVERARNAPERKEQERQKVGKKAVVDFTKSTNFKEIIAKISEEATRLVKEEKLSPEEASAKAQATIMPAMMAAL